MCAHDKSLDDGLTIAQLRLHVFLAVKASFHLQSLRLGGDAEKLHPFNKDSLPQTIMLIIYILF